MAHQSTVRVMAVEHHAPLREGLIALLKSQTDIELVCTASTAEEALKEYLRFLPEVVIVDLHLPGGLDLIRGIRKSTSSARIIPLLGYDWDDDSRAALDVTGLTPLAAHDISSRLLDVIRNRNR